MKLLQQWSQAFNQLSRRERLLVLLTLIVAVSMPAMVYVIEPLSQQQRALQATIAQLEISNAAQTRDIQTLAGGGQNPNEVLRQRIEAQRQKLAQINQQLLAENNNLVSPATMMQLLQQQLLADEALRGSGSGQDSGQGLRVLSLLKADPEPLELVKEGTALNTTMNLSGLYKHPLTLELAGSVTALLAYVQRLEQLPQQFFWHSLEVTVAPDGRLDSEVRAVLQVHTLSTERGWLGVDGAQP